MEQQSDPSQDAQHGQHTMQHAAMGDGSMEIHEASGAKLTEDSSGVDLSNSVVVHEDKNNMIVPDHHTAKFQVAMKPLVQIYRVTCLNCGAQLHVELPHSSGSFQCCQCHAVHKVIHDSFAMADQNKKRKRNKDKPMPTKHDGM